MLNILVSIIGILITILLVVGVHEFGHFLVAKLCGIKVLRFSIGFGKALLRVHDKSGTEYVLAMLPFGGYVKMLDENEESVPASESHLSYNCQPLYKKFAVIAAGPLFNLLFAFLIYWLLFVVGFDTFAPITGKITPNSVAAASGMKSGQEILQVDNQDAPKWIAIVINLLARAGDTDHLTILTKDLKTLKTQQYQLNLANWKMDPLTPDPLESLGIGVYEPVIPNVIGKILADSPASKADLAIGDRIIAVNDVKTPDWKILVEQIVDKPNNTLAITVLRNHKILNLHVTVGSKSLFGLYAHGFLGLSPDYVIPDQMLHKNKFGPIDATLPAWEDVKLFTKINFIVLGKMLTGKISLQSLGGPISIFESAGVALNNGLFSFFKFFSFFKYFDWYY